MLCSFLPRTSTRNFKCHFQCLTEDKAGNQIRQRKQHSSWQHPCLISDKWPIILMKQDLLSKGLLKVYFTSTICLTLPNDTLTVMVYGGTNGTPAKIGSFYQLYGRRHYETVIPTIVTPWLDYSMHYVNPLLLPHLLSGVCF